MNELYLKVGCPKCKAPRGCDCTGDDVASGQQHQERADWWQALQKAVDRECI